MRIGMLADVYKPHVSGITNYIALNKSVLEKAGHQVYVFTFGDEDYPDDEHHVIRSPGLPLVDSGYYISFRYKKEARHLLYTMDIVHVHHPFLSGQIALRYCRPRGIPIVFTNHTRYDLYAQVYIPVLPDVIGETILQTYLPIFCRSCDLVVAPSNGMREILKRFGVDSPVEVIPNGVDLKLFSAPDESQKRAQFGFGKSDVLFIYVGRLGLEKNLSFLLRSFAGTAQAFEQVRLMVIGDGPERENLMNQALEMGISSKVIFTGMVPYEDLPGYLALADAFITASVTEVHPLSVIEAMAAGLPVLGILSPGIADTIEDGVTGYLANEDLAAFTAKMVRLVTDQDQRRTMGIQAKETSLQYDIQLTNELMFTQYTRLIQQSKGRKRGFRYNLTRFLDNWRP